MSNYDYSCCSSFVTYLILNTTYNSHFFTPPFPPFSSIEQIIITNYSLLIINYSLFLIHFINLPLVVLVEHATLDLQCVGQFTLLHREMVGQQCEALDLLVVGQLLL